MTLGKHLSHYLGVFLLPCVPQTEEAGAWKILCFMAAFEFIWHFSVRGGMLGKVAFEANEFEIPASLMLFPLSP